MTRIGDYEGIMAEAARMVRSGRATCARVDPAFVYLEWTDDAGVRCGLTPTVEQYKAMLPVQSPPDQAQ